MAKQTGAVQFVGKLANVVGFKNALAAKPSTKFVRERATTVGNPKSYAQAKQRAKVRPAQIFYDAFVEVLNHAFIPKGRASKNRLEFLSGAMSLDYVPDVMKGEFKIPFAPYQVSRGTLGLDSLCIGSTVLGSLFDGAGDGFVSFPLMVSNFTADDYQANEQITVADFSTNVLADNTGLVNGQELTFIIVGEDDITRQRSTSIFTVVFDTTDNVNKLKDCFTGRVLLLKDDDEHISIGFFNGKALAVGLIISSRTDTSWRYTNSFMALSGYAIDGFDWEVDDIIRSYMSTASAAGTSDLILQQADNDNISGYSVSSVNNVGFTLNQGVTGTPTFNAAAVASLSSSGVSLGRRVVVGELGQLQNYTNGVWTGINLELEDETIAPLLLSQTSLAGSPTISKAEVIAAGF